MEGGVANVVTHFSNAVWIETTVSIVYVKLHILRSLNSIGCFGKIAGCGTTILATAIEALTKHEKKLPICAHYMLGKHESLLKREIFPILFYRGFFHRSPTPMCCLRISALNDETAIQSEMALMWKALLGAKCIEENENENKFLAKLKTPFQSLPAIWQNCANIFVS